MTKTANNQTLSTMEWNTASKVGLTVSTIGIIAGVVIAHLAIGGQAGIVLAGVSGVGFVAFAIAVYATHNKKAGLSRKTIKSTAELCVYLKNQNITKENVSQVLQSIDPSFFVDKSHERAKKVFYAVMEALFGVEVAYVTAADQADATLTPLRDFNQVAHLAYTKGVEYDIGNSALDTEHVHIYQVASQYNAAETTHPFTPAVGEAMRTSANDRTQGPLAQRTNPIVFEVATAFLANLGFNMMAGFYNLSSRLSSSEASDFTTDSPIAHGYLRPTTGNIRSLTEAISTRPEQIEYVCYPSDVAKNKNPVYIFLQAAPDVSKWQGQAEETDDLEKYAAYANYVGLFNHSINLFQEKHKSVIVHAAAVGGGAFANKPQNILWGFQRALDRCGALMKKNKVFVQLEAFNGKGAMQQIADKLHIQTKSRIGDPESTK